MCKVTAFFLLGLVALTWGFPTEEDAATGRIYGGSQASLFDAIFMASLRDNNDNHFCGGALITTRNVVTAASCLLQRHAANVRVVVGSNELDGEQRVVYNASKLLYKDVFDAVTRRNDIGLITTEMKVILGNRVGLAPMRIATMPGAVDCKFFGWGNARHPGSVENHLKRMDTRTIGQEACATALADLPIPLRDGNICTFTRVGQGFCSGDVGGPLVTYNTKELIGVASWTPTRNGGECAFGLPDVYTRISPHYNWIMDNAILEFE